MILTSDNFYQTRYVIENLIKNTNITGSIYVALIGRNDDDDYRMISYLESNPEIKGGILISYENKNLASLKNKLISKVTEKYVCFVPADVLVNLYWAESLIEAYENFIDVGVIGIRKDTDIVFFKPLLRHHATQDDYLESILSNDTKSVEGLIFFEKESVSKIGLYDDTLNAPAYADMQLCYLLNNHGKNNFYIKKQVALTIDVKDDILYPAKDAVSEAKFNTYKINNPSID